ncbi:cupredoxin domain-containing protein [Marinobacteraceae bacterium S3BR75-40.1]
MPFRIITGLFATLLMLGASTAVMAAGGHGDGHHGGGHHGGSVDIGQPGQAGNADRTVKVVMKDNFYDPEKVTVKKGETIRFQIRNEGSLVHEFNIGTRKMHQGHRGEMMNMVKQGIIQGGELHHDKMQSHGMKHDDPNSVLLEPGKSAEIVWEFNSDADLQFACNVPGHYESGMVGDIDMK